MASRLSVAEICVQDVVESPDAARSDNQPCLRRGVVAPGGRSVLFLAHDHSVRRSELCPTSIGAATLACTEAAPARNVAWCPFPTTTDGRHTVFIACAQGVPLHLWDAETAACRGSYTLRSHMDELLAPYCALWPQAGHTLVSGHGRGFVALFDVARPTAPPTMRFCSKAPGAPVVLTLAEVGPLMAAGTTAGTVELLDPRTGFAAAILRGHRGAVCSVASAGDVVLSSGRSDGADIVMHDLRCVRDPVGTFAREGRRTQQPLGFAVRGNAVAAAAADTGLLLFDLRDTAAVRAVEGPAATTDVSFVDDATVLAVAGRHSRAVRDRYEERDPGKRSRSPDSDAAVDDAPTESCATLLTV